MTEDTTTSTAPRTTAGALLRQYREAQGFKLDVLAQALRVSSSKLQALEDDRLDELPDAMFARALTLAVCRQLKTDATPVLALLPSQDVSRLAPKDERGLDFPLDRPSFLPQSSLVAVVRLFTPLRWAAVAVLGLALLIGFWPDIRSLLVFKDEPAVEAAAAPAASLPVVLPPAEEAAPVADLKSSNMVVTTVHSTAVAVQPSNAVAPASASGVQDAR